ncbi:hypothetical protein KYC_25748 [Achromobacter arsenitoxydans SY8]|uniref:Uncharacterized protein n=1 Tax=Achromobacter arsenitoxydans SY8 TaxID=477184 RepID=H0FED8_9BURK|nr:hypothetical protein KYC_25748 [Achromobacter arsenitoxydans SY8]
MKNIARSRQDIVIGPEPKSIRTTQRLKRPTTLTVQRIHYPSIDQRGTLSRLVLSKLASCDIARSRLKAIRTLRPIPIDNHEGLFSYPPGWGKRNVVFTAFWLDLNTVQISISALAIIIMFNAPLSDLMIRLSKHTVLHTHCLFVYSATATQQVQTGPSQQSGYRIKI